jgi:DNA repair exonuclease SbcCD nuclease subunit
MTITTGDGDVRVLLLADSHLGFDLPARPRVDRRRRGHDFLANYARALAPALAGQVDAVVHAGDVFDRSHVIPTVAYQAFEPLRRIADAGIPVFIVPGNHERSRLPHLRFAAHPNIHVFATPRTITIDVRGVRVAFAGFPYERDDVRARLTNLLAQTAWDGETASHYVLCMHHCVEGTTVGPGNYTFTTAPDVVRLRDIPSRFSAVLSGHIHRHQVITTDLARRPVETPVLYPGSIERTSIAEIDEPKGYMLLHLGASRDARARWDFRHLPARPMIRQNILVDGMTDSALALALDAIIAASPADAVLSIRVSGSLTPAQWRVLAPARLRAVAPGSMNVEITPSGGFARPTATRRAPDNEGSAQLTLE